MDVFRFAPDQQQALDRALRLYARLLSELDATLPASCHVLHVGATAIPNCLTKSDLDLAVRCHAADFPDVDGRLARRFERNRGSVRTADFSAFEDRSTSPECGIQLTVRGGALDVFHLFADALRNDPALVRRYNEPKRRNDGRPQVGEKDRFTASVLDPSRISDARRPPSAAESTERGKHGFKAP